MPRHRAQNKPCRYTIHFRFIEYTAPESNELFRHAAWSVYGVHDIVEKCLLAQGKTAVMIDPPPPPLLLGNYKTVNCFAYCYPVTCHVNAVSDKLYEDCR